MIRKTMCALALCAASPALADIDLTVVDSCIQDARAKGSNPNNCLDQAHQTCLADSAEAPAAATLCFTNARKTWSDGIGAQMDALADIAPERVVALAGIEVKYDLLASLVQCDRLEELAQLKETPASDILLQKTRCAATASGLAYLRMLWRMPTPPTGPEKDN